MKGLFRNLWTEKEVSQKCLTYLAKKTCFQFTLASSEDEASLEGVVPELLCV